MFWAGEGGAKGFVTEGGWSRGFGKGWVEERGFGRGRGFGRAGGWSKGMGGWWGAKGDSGVTGFGQRVGGATGFGQRDWVEQRGLGRGIGWSKGVLVEGLGRAKGFW